MPNTKKWIVSTMPFRSYDQEQHLLQSYRHHGWQVYDCSLFGYSLFRVTPADKQIQLILSKDYHSLQRAQTSQWHVVCSSPLLHVLEGEKDAPAFHDAWTASLARNYRFKSRFWMLLGACSLLVFLVLVFILSTTKLPSGAIDFLFFLLSIIVSVFIISFSRWLWLRFVLSKVNKITNNAERRCLYLL